MSGNWILSSSLLSADFTCLGDQVAALGRAGADWLHVDVMDGHFAPNIGMGPMVVDACRRVSAMPVDVHLMVENPERYIEPFARAGANLITIHIETDHYPYNTLQAIRDHGCRAGIALKPGTPVSMLTQVLPLVDLVLVLGTDPGFSGQAFLPQMLSRITTIRGWSHDVLIQVDGGMNAETLPPAFRAGANVFVAGSAVFTHPRGIGQGIKSLRALV